MGILGGCFLVLALCIQHPSEPYQVISSNSHKTVIKLDPKAYIIKVFTKKYDKKADFAINTNFFWKNKPIGFIKDFELLPSIVAHNFNRPIFMVDYARNPSIGLVQNHNALVDYSTATQAGPWLIKNNEIAYPHSMKDGIVSLDVARKTRHTAIGLTAANKIVLYYNSNTDLLSASKDLIKLGCINAMNLDGGSSSFLKNHNRVCGNHYPKYGIQFIRSKPVSNK